MSCRPHDWELSCADATDEGFGAVVVGREVCARCGAERSWPLERRRFAARLIDKAKKLVARGARGRQGRMFA